MWCGHSASQCPRHHKILQYQLTVNHKTKSTESHRNSVAMELFKHFTKDQIMFTHSVLTYVKWSICQFIEQQKTVMAVEQVYKVNDGWFHFSAAFKEFYTNRWSQYRVVLSPCVALIWTVEKPFITTPYLPSAPNDWESSRRLNNVYFKDITITKFYILLQQQQQQQQQQQK